MCVVCVFKAKLYNGLRNNNANPFLLIYFTLHELIDFICRFASMDSIQVKLGNLSCLLLIFFTLLLFLVLYVIYIFVIISIVRDFVQVFLLPRWFRTGGLGEKLVRHTGERRQCTGHDMT